MESKLMDHTKSKDCPDCIRFVACPFVTPITPVPWTPLLPCGSCRCGSNDVSHVGDPKFVPCEKHKKN